MYIRFVLNNAVVPLEPLAACKSDKNAAAVGICKLDTFIGTQSKALSGADFGNCAKSEWTLVDLDGGGRGEHLG